MTQINIGLNGNNQNQIIKTNSKKRINFDGVDDYIGTGISPYAINNSASGDLTLQFTVNFNNDFKLSHMMVAANAGGHRFYFITRASYGIGIGLLSWYEDIPNFFDIDRDVVVTVTLSGTTGRLYKNGELVVERTGITGEHQSTEIAIGGRTSYFSKTEMEDVRIWKRALTAEEVKEHATYQTITDKTGLVGWWKLDEGTGNVARDSSGNRWNGRIYGATWKDVKKKEHALYLDGVDDYISFPNPEDSGLVPSLDAEIDFLFHKFGTTGVYNYIFALDTATYLTIRNSDKRLFASLRIDGIQKTFSSNLIMEENTRYKLRWTFSNGIMRIYNYGVLIDERDVTLGSVNFLSNMRIGTYTTGSSYLNGTLYYAKVNGVIFNFDEGVGSIIRDSSSKGKHGTLYGGNWKKINNRLRSTLDFDGVDDYVEVPHSDNISTDNALTVSAWYYSYKPYPENIGGIVVKGQNGGWAGNEYGLRGNSASMTFYIADKNNSDIHQLSSPRITGRWVHILGTTSMESGKVQLYIDGNIVSELPRTVQMANKGVPLYIAKGYSTTFFNGMIKDVGIWNRYMTQDEIRDIMNNGIKGHEEGLVGCWHLDRGVGSIAVDSSKYGNHGEIHGAVWKGERDNL